MLRLTPLFNAKADALGLMLRLTPLLNAKADALGLMLRLTPLLNAKADALGVDRWFTTFRMTGTRLSIVLSF